MFTGIIQHTPKILTLSPQAQGIRLSIKNPLPHTACSKGESIAVNGICLTVEKITRQSLTFFAQKETIEKTTLSSLKPGQIINFERALRQGDRIGGHLVQGHVDEAVKILGKTRKGASYCFEFSVPRHLTACILEKGSVALDGISLTVSSIKRQNFSVDIIPLTYKETNIHISWKSGTNVNLETDLTGRQIHRSVQEILKQKKMT